MARGSEKVTAPGSQAAGEEGAQVPSLTKTGVQDAEKWVGGRETGGGGRGLIVAARRSPELIPELHCVPEMRIGVMSPPPSLTSGAFPLLCSPGQLPAPG